MIICSLFVAFQYHCLKYCSFFVEKLSPSQTIVDFFSHFGIRLCNELFSENIHKIRTPIHYFLWIFACHWQTICFCAKSECGIFPINTRACNCYNTIFFFLTVLLDKTFFLHSVMFRSAIWL